MLCMLTSCKNYIVLCITKSWLLGSDIQIVLFTSMKIWWEVWKSCSLWTKSSLFSTSPRTVERLAGLLLDTAQQEQSQSCDSEKCLQKLPKYPHISRLHYKIQLLYNEKGLGWVTLYLKLMWYGGFEGEREGLLLGRDNWQRLLNPRL